jgi:hypothetical protein
MPLRFATYFGIGTMVASFVAVLIYLSGQLFFDANWPVAFAALVVAVLLRRSLRRRSLLGNLPPETGKVASAGGRVTKALCPLGSISAEVFNCRPVRNKPGEPVR